MEAYGSTQGGAGGGYGQQQAVASGYGPQAAGAMSGLLRLTRSDQCSLLGSDRFLPSGSIVNLCARNLGS